VERATAPRARWPAADARECWLDAAAIGDELAIRFRRSGDRFQPLGMRSAKRLQDFFVDAGVPRAARDRVPLVLSGERIAWVVGWRIADWARVQAPGRPIVRVRFEPEAEP
jgi:tRNA(Ile)-lysidine synthase